MGSPRTQTPRTQTNRRDFLRGALLAGVAAGAPGQLTSQAIGAAPATGSFKAGEGSVDITPPLGITLGGFHYHPDRPRNITGVRQPAFARALVVRGGQTTAAIISVDMLNIDFGLKSRVQARVAREVGIPAAHVRICSTHTHSMPSTAFNRHWGAVSKPYLAQLETAMVRAVKMARDDLTTAAVYVGTSTTDGANFNRTASRWSTEEQFSDKATDADRWLDTDLQVIHIERTSGRRSLLWYHFSAHPTCYNDTLSGPDWPGEVARLLRDRERIEPSFLQGHIGDVAPSNAQQTAMAVARGIREALDQAARIDPAPLRVATAPVAMPLDMALFRKQIAQYRDHPEQCRGGEWVDGPFAKDWYDTFATKFDLTKTTQPIELSAIRMGPLALVFHPAELYSYYGLAIRKRSPLPHTLVVGYSDGYIGYVADPQAYRGGEYAAMVVPKILNYPPFTPTAGRHMTGAASELLQQVAT